MKIHYYFGARQTGKTTTSLFLLNDQPKALLVSHRFEDSRSELIKNAQNRARYSTLKYWQFGHAVKWETLILDEYHYSSIKEKIEVLEFIKNHPTIKTIYVFTTPKHKYSRRVLDLIGKLKHEGMTPTAIACELYETLEFEVPIMSPANLEAAVEFLYYDIIMLGYGTFGDVEMKIDEAIVFHRDKIRKIDADTLGPYRDSEVTGKFFTNPK